MKWIEKFSVIPIHGIVDGKCTCGQHECNSPGKHPAIPSWQEFQKRKPTGEEIETWKKRYPARNWAIITGQVSGLIVLDCDGDEGKQGLKGKHLPLTWTVKTGNGIHYYYQHPGGNVSNGVKVLPGLDIRADGGYIVAPGSRHLNGNQYAWIPGMTPDDIPEPAPCPEWLIKLLKAPRVVSAKERLDPVKILAGVSEGERDNTLYKYACRLQGKGLTQEEATLLVTEAAKNCKPAFPENQAVLKVKQAFKHTPPEPEPEKPHHRNFPEFAYSGIAKEFTELYSRYTEVPRSFLYFCFLTYLGTLIGHRVSIESELCPQPRLYVVILGASAETRKSTALALTDKLFRESIEGDFVHYGLGSMEGLASRLNVDRETKEVRPCLVYLDELRLLVDKSRLDGSILLPALCSLFETNRFDNTTKTQKISVRQAFLSLLGACTTETYSQMWTSAFLNIGFTNRLWIVPDETIKKEPLPPVIPKKDKDDLRIKLAGILQMVNLKAGHGVFEYTMTPEARKIWNSWYERTARNIYTRRLDTYGWRLMILQQVCNADFGPIEADTVQQVVAMLQWQADVREMCDPVDAENTNAKMEQLILRNLQRRGPLTRRELQQCTNARRYGLYFFQQALTNLKENIDVKWDKTSKRFFTE